MQLLQLLHLLLHVRQALLLLLLHHAGAAAGAAALLRMVLLLHQQVELRLRPARPVHQERMSFPLPRWTRAGEGSKAGKRSHLLLGVDGARLAHLQAAAAATAAAGGLLQLRGDGRALRQAEDAHGRRLLLLELLLLLRGGHHCGVCGGRAHHLHAKRGPGAVNEQVMSGSQATFELAVC